MEWSAQNSHPRQVSFCSSHQLKPDARKLRLRKPLWSILPRTVIRSPESFSANCFQMLVLEKIPKVSLLVISHLSRHSWSRILSFREVFLVPFLPLSNRIVHANSKLLRKYWADLLSELFGIRARCLKHPRWSVWCLCYSFFQHSTTQCTDTLDFWMTGIFESFHHLSGCSVPFSFRCFMKSSIPLLFVSRTEERPLSLRESLRVRLDFFWIRKTNSIVSLSCPIDVVEHWHEDDSVCELFKFNVSLSKIILDFSEESAMTKIPGECSTRIQLVLIDSQQFCVRSGHFEFFHLTFPSYNCISVIKHLHQTQHGICAYTHFCLCPLDHLITRQCRSRPWDVLSIVCTFRISSGCSNSVGNWINSEFRRSSSSCRLPSSPNNLVQDERLLSLTNTWTFSISTHWSLMLQVQMLSTLL